MRLTQRVRRLERRGAAARSDPEQDAAMSASIAALITTWHADPAHHARRLDALERARALGPDAVPPITIRSR